MKHHAMNNMFDPLAWRQRCEAIAQESNRGCGLVYESYERSFTITVNAELSRIDKASREQAIEIASRYGYASAAQLAATEAMLLQSGACQHGLEPYNCPVGCGDSEVFEEQDWQE